MVELSAAAAVAVVAAAAPPPAVILGFASALATLFAELDICVAPVTIC
jgi:hypothetical protein